jgi:hypothetical protein
LFVDFSTTKQKRANKLIYSNFSPKNIAGMAGVAVTPAKPVAVTPCRDILEMIGLEVEKIRLTQNFASAMAQLKQASKKAPNYDIFRVGFGTNYGSKILGALVDIKMDAILRALNDQ